MKNMTFKEFVKNEKDSKLEVIDIVASHGFSNYYYYGNYLNELFQVDKIYLDNIIRYDNRKLVR